jgi:hypothetical protein
MELDILSALDGLEEPLPYIFAEELPWEEGVGESLMQAGMVLSLIELLKGAAATPVKPPPATRRLSCGLRMGSTLDLHSSRQKKWAASRAALGWGRILLCADERP